MTSSGPGSRSGSSRSGGGGGPGSGSGSGGSFSLTPLASATPSTSTAAGAVSSALPSCLMPQAFTSEGDFEDYLQQFTTAATLSGWQTATTDNRPNYFALRLKGNALHFYTTLTVAQQQNFDQLVAAFRTTYTTNFEVLKAKLKAARQQPNQTIAAFLCDIRTLARRVYRGQPLIEEQMVLTSFIEGLHDEQLRWELLKSKPANPSDKKFKKLYHKQIKTLGVHVHVVPTVAPFILIVPGQIDKVQVQIRIKIIEIQTTIAIDTTKTIRTIDTIIVAINKTTDTIIIAIHQTSNKPDITQINNRAGIVTEQITSPGIVKHVLIAEDWDTCLVNVEHHDRIKTIGNKIRLLNKIHEISTKTATKISHNNKIL